MKEYIEREAVVSELNRIEKLYQNTYMSNVRAEMVSYCCQVIKHIPAADVVKVRHGKWVAGRKIGREFVGSRTESVLYDEWGCNCCGLAIRTPYKPIYKYCPNCGAKMTEDYHEQKE